MKHLKPLLAIIGLLVFAHVPAATKDFDLHQAVLDKNITLVKKLLSKGAAIDVIGSRKYGYGSALHLAVREGHLEIAKLLLDRGAQVDVLDPDDFTPLHNAAWNGNLEMAKLLLEAGADITASTYDGDTPLKLAQNNDKAQVAKFIQAKLQPSATSEVKVESTPVSDSGVIDISGTYIGELEGPRGLFRKFFKKPNSEDNREFEIVQNADQITVTYDDGRGKIYGDIRGDDTIKIEWDGYGSYGQGIWTVKPGSNEINGTVYATSIGAESGKINLTRIETTPPPSLTGTYTAKVSYDNLGAQDPLHLFGKRPNLQINLKQTDDTITGVISGDRSGEITGVMQGNKVLFDYYIIVPGTGSREGQGTWFVGDDPATLSGDFKITTDVNKEFFGKWNLTKIE